LEFLRERAAETVYQIVKLHSKHRKSLLFKKHAQDGRGIKRPPEERWSVSSPLVARVRALCASNNATTILEFSKINCALVLNFAFEKAANW
jgi:hypothetical protein